MLRFTMIAALAALSTAAVAAPVERVRGTIESANGTTFTLKQDDGSSKSISLGSDTTYASVVKSSLDQIKDGVFVGTATKGDNPPTALEVVLFPEKMRGTGEGHYDWDEIQDTTTGGSKVKSSMTNGTVKAATGGMPKVKSSMTNGTVAKSTGATGAKTLTVTYGKDGGTQTITVPPSAPIVTFEPADAAIMKPGAKVFVIAGNEDGKLSAKRVAVGKDGLRPPM
ncbi:metal ABC transporter permease [Methylobacterium sp. C25]|uniref:metal ABC transporter permease n=1 Tax=Methylobacterium sp. C25 TaxID=2721622 RepID=UPI001F423729|nr:metal ABC transporter permease [Methylobacterium sp. C25]MCE4224539.1 metal ABC transporter permease [Methylobacterium sp. C25]